ncbi:MAG: hypothetical protein JSU62_04515 [Gammaproteobacteria bacterium]|nr:MAG: hypothetical protein JSU62_04515 [Gammaproteobacteria bacterium]
MAPGSAPLPPAALSGDPAVFGAYLRRTGQAFVLLGEPQDNRVRVRFSGRFESAEVVWDCEFVTLQHEQQCHGGAPRGEVDSLRSFIEIGAPGAQGVPVRVGLDIARIDRPAILKMMVMMRNYKRLRRGRHEFGASRRGG